MPFELEDEVNAPGFYDVYDAADVSLPKRVARRYFVTQNYDRSMHMHERLGSKLMRSVVMNTVGRLRREKFSSNYRIGERGNPLDRAAKFAFGGSVFNEVVHTVGAIPTTINLVRDSAENGFDPTNPNIIFSALNLSLVAVQRYNRARMIEFLDETLQAGEEFSPGYENWAGIDSTALAAHQSAQIPITQS